MSTKAPHPPRWAERFLTWYCKESLLEDLQGDLKEYFERNVKDKGTFRAKCIYIVDVIKFIRPYTLRKPEFINVLIHWLMIRSYIKTSFRSIVRHTLFSSINIVGLAISMSVGLLMIVFLSDLFSYDDFHVNRDRTYRVTTVNEYLDHPRMKLASSSVAAGKKIRETVPGVESLTIMRRGFGGDAQVGDSRVPLQGLWADNYFFDVFSFNLISGDKSTALKEPNSIIVTEKTAIKLFGETKVLGRSVKFDSIDYVVTGVMRDIPKLSHVRFEALVSFSTVELQQPAWEGPFEGWETFYSNYTYMVLGKGADMSLVQATIDKICQVENANIQHRKISLELQPLSEIVVGENLSNPIGPALNRFVIWILFGLAVVVVVSACFNYTNLSIARSLRRSREVGIRKVIGAANGHVIGQFIAESVIVSLMALVFSFLIFMFLRVQFVSLGEFIDNLVSLHLSPEVIAYFIAFAVGVGVIAGLFPALFYSKIKASHVLKDASSLKLFQRITLRKALIVLQYTFSLIFITSTLIGYTQYKSFITLDLGFQTSNIVNLSLQGKKDDALIKELAQIPDVNAISRSRIITSVGNMYGTQGRYQNPNDSAVVWLNFIDENYLPIHQHKLLTGRNFNAHTTVPGSDVGEVIVNEELLRRFDITKRDPQKALGETVKADGKEFTIVGVMKDFHYGTVEHKIEPVAFVYSTSEPSGYLNLKVSSTDLPATMARIESVWNKFDEVHPMQAQFYDDRIEENYSQFSVMLKVIGFLGFLAICIASMGLFGMVVFNTERRIKEVSIRKVLGATEGTLVYLLSKGFLFLLFISAGVALPLTYLLFDKVVLTNFVYHQPIGVVELFAGPLAVMMLAFLMIGTQTLKVARTNPADVLKSE